MSKKILIYTMLISALSLATEQQSVALHESARSNQPAGDHAVSSLIFSEVDTALPPVEVMGGWFAKLDEVWVAGPYESSESVGGFELRVYRESDSVQSENPDDISVLAEVGRFDAPAGLKSATVVSEGEYLWILGGRDAEQFVSSVYRLEWDGDQLDIEPGPDLPLGVAYGGAAVLGRHLYYVGGLTNSTGELANEGLWRIPVDVDINIASWEVLDSMPDGGRVLPVVFSLYGQLNVVGGFELLPASQVTLSPTPTNWVYRESPVDGTLDTGWLQRSDIPVSLAASAVYTTGQSHAALIGGYTGQLSLADILAESVPEESLGSIVWLTHLITDTWIYAGDTPFGLPPGTISIEDNQVFWFSSLLPGSALNVVLQRDLKQLVATDYAVIIGYFLLMAGIGVWFARRQTDSDEFALGGRQVKWWASGISMFATGASSISFMAIPAIAFGSNLVWLAPIVIFMVPAFFIQGYLIYPLLRKLNLTSTFTYLEQRYGLPLRMLASLQAIAFQLLGRMSVVMLLPSMAISAVTGLDVVTSVILMGVLTTIYTTFGGFEAVIWTDVLQGGMMVLGCVVMSLVAVFSLSDGVSGFVATSAEYDKFMYAIWEFDWVCPIIWVSILAFFFQQIGFAADQPVVQRVYATPSVDIKKLAAMAAFCGVLIAVLTNFTGLSLFAYFHENPGIHEHHAR
ncbi:MAG: hypothetical protein AAF986_07660 [Pseudomonadota bacterium]